MARAAQRMEELPAHDAVEGLRHPRQTTGLIGQDAAEQSLLEAYRSGRMHHAWILSGERGVGKATLAFRMARFLLAQPGPAAPDVQGAADLAIAPELRAARLVHAGSHPDVLHLQRDWDEKNKRYKTGLSVDGVRRLVPFLGATAAEGGWRIVIVDTADDMSISAENALLKSLEEPPRRTVFLLLAQHSGRLLPTILSRCRILRLRELDPAEAQAALAASWDGDGSREDVRLAAALAGGSVRRLHDLLHGDGLRAYRLLGEALSGKAGAIPSLAARAGTEAGLAQVLGLLEDYLQRRVRGRPEPAGGVAIPRAPSLVTWAELWEKAAEAGREVETYNLDRRQFVTDLFERASVALGLDGTAR